MAGKTISKFEKMIKLAEVIIRWLRSQKLTNQKHYNTLYPNHLWIKISNQTTIIARIDDTTITLPDFNDRLIDIGVVKLDATDPKFFEKLTEHINKCRMMLMKAMEIEPTKQYHHIDKDVVLFQFN